MSMGDISARAQFVLRLSPASLRIPILPIRRHESSSIRTSPSLKGCVYSNQHLRADARRLVLAAPKALDLTRGHHWQQLEDVAHGCSQQICSLQRAQLLPGCRANLSPRAPEFQMLHYHLDVKMISIWLYLQYPVRCPMYMCVCPTPTGSGRSGPTSSTRQADPKQYYHLHANHCIRRRIWSYP